MLPPFMCPELLLRMFTPESQEVAEKERRKAQGGYLMIHCVFVNVKYNCNGTINKKYLPNFPIDLSFFAPIRVYVEAFMCTGQPYIM